MLVRITDDIEVGYEDEIHLDSGVYKVRITENDTVGENIGIAEIIDRRD